MEVIWWIISVPGKVLEMLTHVKMYFTASGVIICYFLLLNYSHWCVRACSIATTTWNWCQLVWDDFLYFMEWIRCEKPRQRKTTCQQAILCICNTHRWYISNYSSYETSGTWWKMSCWSMSRGDQMLTRGWQLVCDQCLCSLIVTTSG